MEIEMNFFPLVKEKKKNKNHTPRSKTRTCSEKDFPILISPQCIKSIL